MVFLQSINGKIEIFRNILFPKLKKSMTLAMTSPLNKQLFVN